MATEALSVKVVAVGVAVGLGLMLLFAALVAVVVRSLGFAAAPSGLIISLGTLLLQLAFTALGGYVAARRATQRAILHAAAAGSVLVVVSAAMLLLMTLFPITVLWWSWSNVLAFTLTVPAAILGGWIAGARGGQRAAG